MTNEQLNDLLKVLDKGSVAALDEDTRVRSREWRREKVHAVKDVSLGSLVRDNDYGPSY